MKKISCLVLLLLTALVVCSCGKAEYTFNTVNASDEASKIYSNDKTVEIVELGEGEAALRYGIEGLYTSLDCGVSITITSDEYLIAHAKDEASAKKIYDALDKYRNERVDLFASYAEEQVPKLKNAVLKQEGEYVFFAVSAENETAEKIWKDNLAEVK